MRCIPGRGQKGGWARQEEGRGESGGSRSPLVFGKTGTQGLEWRLASAAETWGRGILVSSELRRGARCVPIRYNS